MLKKNPLKCKSFAGKTSEILEEKITQWLEMEENIGIEVISFTHVYNINCYQEQALLLYRIPGKPSDLPPNPIRKIHAEKPIDLPDPLV